MPLSIEQQKTLNDALYDHILELHSGELQKDLVLFTKNARVNKKKGIVLLDYLNIDDMINSVKNKNFEYQWISETKAKKIKHAGIRSALITMKSNQDCVFVCSLSISQKHLYINCAKFRDIENSAT